MSAVWKKVLFEGNVDISSNQVTGNNGDIRTVDNGGVTLTGSEVTSYTGYQIAANTIIGDSGEDVVVKIDIDAVDTVTGGLESANDFVLIHDASAASSQPNASPLRKVSVGALASQFQVGTTDITFTGDTGTKTVDGNAEFEFEGGKGITTTVSSTGTDAGKVVINANVSEPLQHR